MDTHQRWIVLAVFMVLYAALVISHWGEDYIDFGDGNYLYISSRIADGMVLYRDIMAPQPPCHLYLGALLIKIGRLIGHPLYTVRFFSLLLHLATMLLIFHIAEKFIGKSLEALLASILYLMIPVGFWWSQGYQSEGLLIFLLLLSFYFFIDFTPRGMLAASLFGTLAAFTNMTAVPYILFSIVFLFLSEGQERRAGRSIVAYYILPMLILGISGVLMMERLTNGAFLQNVFLNQVGTFPKPEISGEGILSYALRKIINEGKDVLTLEGGYVIFGLAGLTLFALEGKERDKKRRYISWYAFFSFCSIIYVAKGGTMDYIFTIGEPFVAVFFAYFLGRCWRDFLKGGAIFQDVSRADILHYIAGLAAIIMLFIATFLVGIVFVYNTLRGDNYELPKREMRVVKELIETHTRPADYILSPPFYAFITGRRVVEEYSENYIWTIKYANEVFVDKKPGEGVRKALAIAQALRECRIPIVLLDTAQTGKLPPIKSAIDEYYEPLNFRNNSNILQTLNTRIAFYIPKKTEGEK